MATRHEVLEAARKYKFSSWQIVPIPHGQKAPHHKGWVDLHSTEDQLPTYFSNGQGIGCILGRRSGNLTDIDVDARQAISIAKRKLPPTNAVFGRASKPSSHHLYIVRGDLKPQKFTDTDGTCLVELRGDNQQTVFPPSMHPSGEQIQWERDGAPAEVDAEDLSASVAWIAAATLLARHWPQPGSRHDASLPLAGMLARSGWTEEDTVEFVSVVTQAAGDEQWAARVANVRSTFLRIADGRETTGMPRLTEIFGKKVVSCVSRWLKLETQPQIRNANPYRVVGGRICYDKETQRTMTTIPLCNFDAHIDEEVVLDNGVETSRAFMITGELDFGEKLQAAIVPTSRYSSMNWPTEHWGARAIVSAGFSNRELLREAIQRLSSPRRRRVFTHTGWRQIDGNWVFLSATGAVGCDGVEVDLGPELDRYRLPSTPENPREAMMPA